MKDRLSLWRAAALAWPPATVMIGVMLLSLSGFWRLQPEPGAVWTLAVTVSLAALAGHRWPLTTLGLAVAAAGILVALPPGREAWEILQDTVSAAWSGEFAPLHPTLAWAALAMCGLSLSLSVFREALLEGSSSRALLSGMLLFLAQWLLFYPTAFPYWLTYVLAGFLLWAVAHGDSRWHRWREQGWRVAAPPRWLFSVVVVVVAAAGSLLVPPRLLGAGGLEATVEQWRFDQNWIQALRGDAPGTGPGLRGIFSLATTGFGDPGQLGGPVYPDPRPAFRVHLDQPVNGALYLRGSVATRYTGQGWDLGAVPRTIAVNAGEILPGEEPPQRVPLRPPPSPLELGLDITPLRVTARNVFHPLQLLSVQAPAGRYRVDADGNTVASTPLPVGKTYRVESRVAAGNGDAGVLHVIPPAELHRYLELPDGLPARVGDLARRITRGLGSQQDKAQAVISYLQSRYPYNLRVPAPSSDRDFVDHFLFTSRSGYCTYYSTAMVVILREVGIPARWVQGFALTATNAQDFDVPLSAAHAWVEVHLPGQGWVTMDPTPRADLLHALPLAAGESSTPAAEQPPVAEEQEPRQPETTTPQEPTPADTAGGEPAALTLAGTGLNQQRWLVVMALGAALVVMLAAIAAVRRWSGRRDPDTALQLAFSRFRRTYSRRLGAGADLTPREFAAAAGRRYPALADLAMAVATAYERVRYGPPGTRVDPQTHAQARQLLRVARRARPVATTGQRPPAGP